MRKRHICSNTACEAAIPPGKAARCVICRKLFCRDCVNLNDMPIAACDECIINAVNKVYEDAKPLRQAAHEKRLREAKARLTRIEKLKGEIAARRDQLRKEVADVEDICETLECGCDEIDNGLRDLNDGLDAISELL